MNRILRWSAALSLVASLFVPVANAQVLGLRFQPAIVEERLEPGATFESKLNLTNEGPTTNTYYLSVRDIRDVGADNRPIFAEPGERVEHGVSSWVALSAQSLTIGPGQSKELTFTVRVPKDAFPGSHFGGIFASLNPQRPTSTGTGVGFEAGPVLIFRMAGDANETARIREFAVDKNVFSRIDANFSVRVENQGNVLVRPRGPIEITNMFGKKVASMIVNEEALSVFPGKDRTYASRWISSNVGFGRYQALVSLVYGEDSRQTITSAVSFWVLPFNIIIPVVLGVLVIFLAVFVFLRLYIRRRLAAIGAPAVTRPKDITFSRLLGLTFAMLVFVLFLLFLLAMFFGG